MVGLLTSLKWRLWKGGYRQDKKRIIALVLGLVYAIPFLAAMAIGLPLLGWFFPDVAMPLLVVIGALALLLWAVIPLASFGLDDTLAANKFAQFPVRAKQLQPGLFASAFISVPVMCTVLGTLALIVAAMVAIGRGTGSVLGIVLVPFAFAAGLVLCVVLPRALVTATSVGGVSRRRKEIGGILFFVVLLLAVYGMQIFFTAEADRLAQMDFPAAASRIGLIAGWTPLGAPFAVPFHAAQGNWLSLLGAIVLTAAVLVAVWLWWRHSLERTLVTGISDHGGGAARRLKGSFIPAFYPNSPLGAVAARSLRYWLRDKRYLVNLILMPIIATVLIVLFVVQGNPVAAIAAPLMMAWAPVAVTDDFGYDGPSMWVNITSGVDAKTNLMGRSIAALTVIAPLVAVFSIAGAVVAGRLDWLWPAFGGALGLVGCLLGLAAILSVYLPYPVKSPAASAFSSGASGGVGAFLSALVAMLGLFIPMIPAAIVYVLGATLVPWLLWIAPLVALASGYAMLRLGWHLGARGLQQREPEIFAVVRNWAE